MAALGFQDYEKPAKREKQSVRIGYVYRRTYDVPAGADSDLIPSRGDVVQLRDVTDAGSDLLRPRVMSDPQRRQMDSATIRVVMTFIQPVAYS